VAAVVVEVVKAAAAAAALRRWQNRNAFEYMQASVLGGELGREKQMPQKAWYRN